MTAPELEPILDVGCGTGVAGLTLWERGARSIHGLDISPEMLTEAGKRRTEEGQTVYSRLDEADLTRPLPQNSDTFGAVISVGTFTHGHVGPEAIDELVRIARPGAPLCLGVNSQFYEAAGFADKVARLQAAGLIARSELRMARIYDDPPEGHEADTALAVTLIKSE